MNPYIKAAAVFVLAVLVPTAVGAQTWSNPTVAPTGGNASAPLNVSGTAQSKAAGLVVGTSAVTYGLLVQNGSVGIGTLTPASKLSVVSGGTGSGIELRGAGSYTGFTIGRVAEDGAFAVAAGNGHFNNQASAGDIVVRGGADELILHGFQGIKFTTGMPSNEAERVRFAQNGNVGIGTASPSFKLDVSGSVGATAFYYTSDKALKKDIAPLSGSLQKILQLQAVSFTWKEDGKKSIGLVAQDVEKVYPELVHTNPESGVKSIEYANLVAPLIEAVKEQQKEIEALKGQVEALQRSR